MGIVLGALTFDGNLGAAIILSLVFGELGAFLAMKLYKLGVFIQCFSTGFIVGLVIFALVSASDLDEAIPIVTILGIITGVIGVLLTKPIIILSTSVSGGMGFGFILAMIFESNMIVGAFLGLVLSVAGVIYQLHSNKDLKAVATKSGNSVHEVTDNQKSGEFKANELVDNAKTKTDEMMINLQDKVKNKIVVESKEISTEDKELATTYMFKGFENFAYSNSITKKLMPFIEYLLYIITGFLFLRVLFLNNIGSLSMITTLILTIIILLCLVKGKKISVSISLAIIGLSQLIGMVGQDIFYYWSTRHTFMALLEMLIILFIAALLAYNVFSKKSFVEKKDIDNQEV